MYVAIYNIIQAWKGPLVLKEVVSVILAVSARYVAHSQAVMKTHCLLIYALPADVMLIFPLQHIQVYTCTCTCEVSTPVTM